MSFGRKELCEALGIPQYVGKVYVERIVDEMRMALLRGERIELRGLGSFEIVEKAARKGRNPVTGEAIDIPSRRGVKFKPGKWADNL